MFDPHDPRKEITMTTPRIDPRFVPDRRSPAWRALLASTVWLRAGFIGASVFAIGLIMLVTGEGQPMSALASAIAGALLAALAWRHAWTVLSAADVGDAARPGPARAVAFGSPVESAASR
jgi:hypothetical protein